MPDNKTLSQQDRTKLDGIVQKMISNKEPENNIKFVVEDFKSKYGIGGEVKKKESTQPTSQESVWGSNSQPKDAYTSLVIDQQIPQQESVISDGEQPKPILKGLPSVESLKKKTIQPKKETVEIIKDVVPKVAKAISIEKNKEDFSESTQKARKESKSLVDKKQIDQKISEVSGLQNEYAKSLKDIDLAKKQLSDEKAEIDYQLSIGNNTPEFQQKIALHNAKVQENLDKFNLLKDKSEVINYNKKVIESASGNLLRDKAEQGNWFGAIYNKMLESASSMASGAVSRVTDLIAEVVPSEYLIGPKELKRLKDKGLDQNQIDDYIKKSAKKDVLPAIRKGNVELFGDKGTTEEYIKKKESSGLIEGGILGLAGSVPAMLGGVYGRATNFFLMGSDAVEKEMESNPDFQNISENEKLAVIVPIGIANAVLEEFGLQGVMKNNSLVNNLVHKTLLKVGADASADTFKRAMNNEIKSGIASGLFKVGSGFTSEAITGGSQQAAEIGIKDIYNVVKDKKMFQTPDTLSDAVSQISDAAIMEGIGGTVMSTLPAISTAMQNNELGKKSTDFEFEILDNINENSEEFKKLFTTDLKNKMIEGKITKDEAESQLKSFDKMTATFNRMPKDMSIEDKKKSFDLLVEKDKLTDEINGKDESLSTKQKERISEINKELSDISLGVKQEQKTEEVIPVETMKVETTVKEASVPTTEVTPQAYVEELAKTKESDPEAYWSVSEVSPEDAAKGTIIDTPDGSALVKPDGDIAGLFKKLTSDAKGVAQDLLNKAVAAGGVKLDNFDGYLTKQYEKAGFRIASRVPFSLEYGVPDGYNKEKHGTPDVVAMVYDPNNELDIEEKTFDDYDQAIAYRDGFVDQVKTGVNTTQELIDESEKSNDLPSLVQKAKTSLSGILPNVEVVLHNTEEEYKKAVGESLSSGTFVDDTIHINPKRANGRTVAHEVFHAVLLNKVKTDPEAQRITAKMITSIEKSLPEDMKLKLQQFVEEGYNGQEQVWDEEKLAELVGFLADGYPSLSKPTQSLIKQWLDQIAKFFGLKEFTDAEVVDLMNTLSGKVATGEVLTESDIKALDYGASTYISEPVDIRQSKSGESVKVGDHNLSFVKQSDLIDIDKLINEISDKKQKVWFWVADQLGRGNYYDVAIEGEHYLDAGPSFALDPKNRDNNIIWASGKNENEITKLIGKSDYIFIISGSPIKSKLFNKGLIDILSKRIPNFNKFKNDVLASSKIKAINELLQSVNSWEQLKETPKRKDFLISVLDQESKKTPLNETLKKYNAFIDLNSLRDGFYSDNNFELNDIMLVLKPTGFGGKSSHSTYENDILGEVVGVPDKKINSFDIMPTELKDKYSELSKTQQQQVVAPYGIGVKEVAKRTQSSLPIARLKKEGKTEKQISKYLQSKGFTIEQATEAILNYNKQKMNTLQKQEGVFTRDGRNKVITSLDSFKRMFLSAKAFLPKNAFIAKENIEAGIKAQSKIASYLVNDLDVAIKNYDGDKEKVISDFDKFVRGEEVELPDNFIEIGNAMRDHIDKLSYELINSGIVDEYQAENIRKNIGTYLTRSYEVFDKDNWAEKVDQEVLQTAKNFLKKQLLSEATKEAKKKGLDVKSVLENKVDLAINDLIDREGAQSFVSSGKTGSKDVSILKQKTNIPFEIRALMGEYTDPAQNYSRTIFKIASLINNAKFLNTVRDNGIGVYLFEKNDINRPKEFDTLIAAEGSETMNPLNGLYTTKEIAGSLKESAGILNSIEVSLPFEVSSTVKSTYEYYMKLLSTVKWLKTVGSVGTHFKNVSGNITFMLANGYFKPDEYRKSAQVIHNDFFNKTDKELREKMQEYVDAGIVDQSAVLGELRSMFKDADFDKSFERRMNNEELNPSKKFVDKVKRLGKKGVSLAENAYQAEDDYFKVISYETEKSRYAKAMYGKEYSKLTESQQDDVKKYVTEITKNVLPNYGRVPGAVKLVKAFPVVGTFISFQTEALRTAYNIVNLSITELKSSNPDIKKIGALRMAGIISSQAVKYAMMYLIGGAVLGDDEDEKKKKAKRFVAPWSKNSNILIKNEGDGKFSYIDFSASDPFGGIVKPINAMMAGEDLLDGFIEGVKELISPFTNPDILKSMFTEISENKDAYGNQLYNPSDSFEKKSEAILSRVYKTFEPGTVSSITKIAESDGMLNEMAGQFTGYKAKDVDLEKQFSFKISDMKKKEVEVRNIYNRAARKFENKEVSKEELQDAYNQSNQESKKLYEELKNDYDAAIYFGTDAKDLKKEMKRAKVSKEIIRSILTGKFKDMEKKKSPLTDEELKQKNPRLYEMRMKMRKPAN